MKRLYLCIFAVAVIALAAWNLNFGSKTDILSDIELANVEALANDESGSEHCPRLCWSSPVWYCVLETPTAYVFCFERYPY